jgi:hypothetical protein
LKMDHWKISIRKRDLICLTTNNPPRGTKKEESVLHGIVYWLLGKRQETKIDWILSATFHHSMQAAPFQRTYASQGFSGSWGSTLLPFTFQAPSPRNFKAATSSPCTIVGSYCWIPTVEIQHSLQFCGWILQISNLETISFHICKTQ